MREPDLIYQVAKKAALAAGEMILNAKSLAAESKSKTDFVTQTDFVCQATIINILKEAFPKANFLAEEEDFANNSLQDFTWIIDPLDGTKNFIHSLNHSAVSIALYNHKDLIFGLTYNPFKQELFHGFKNGGAYLNGKKIKVAPKRELNHSLIATGFPFRRDEEVANYKNYFSEILLNVADLRRTGSACLDLADVACARYDGFFEAYLSPWDIAAGIVLIREAGGIIGDYLGGSDYLESGCIIIASNQGLYDFLLKTIQSLRGDAVL